MCWVALSSKGFADTIPPQDALTQERSCQIQREGLL